MSHPDRSGGAEWTLFRCVDVNPMGVFSMDGGCLRGASLMSRLVSVQTSSFPCFEQKSRKLHSDVLRISLE